MLDRAKKLHLALKALAVLYEEDLSLAEESLRRALARLLALHGLASHPVLGRGLMSTKDLTCLTPSVARMVSSTVFNSS